MAPCGGSQQRAEAPCLFLNAARIQQSTACVVARPCAAGAQVPCCWSQQLPPESVRYSYAATGDQRR
jgi:hypothetical protein